MSGRRPKGPGLSRIMIGFGVNPVSLIPILPAGPDGAAQCGACQNVVVRTTDTGCFTKCRWGKGHRDGPDLPADLPACLAFTARTGGSDPFQAVPAPAPHRAPIPA